MGELWLGKKVAEKVALFALGVYAKCVSSLVLGLFHLLLIEELC